MRTLGALLALLGYIPAVIIALRSGIFQTICATFTDTAASGSRLELRPALQVAAECAVIGRLYG